MSRAGASARLLAILLASLPCVPVSAQPTDKAVEAQFLPRFARYVTWPPAGMPRGAEPFQLCVVGPDPFGSMLDEAARLQQVDGRGIAVRRMRSAAAAESCQIAFVGSGQSVGQLAERPVLTVTDSAITNRRGIIHFVVAGGRVRFFIDQSSAARRGITINSRLLALALEVR